MLSLALAQAHLLRRVLLVAALVASAGSVRALPVLSIDLDPAAEGAQTTAELGPGESLQVDLLIRGVEAAAPLHAFQLELAGLDHGLVATDAGLADFLIAPVQLLRRVLGPDVVSLAAVTLGPGAAFGEGVLATLTLQGVEPGVASLAFRDVVLSRPFGVAIEGLGLEGATLTVVPEPATSGLVAAGLVALAARRRRRP